MKSSLDSLPVPVGIEPMEAKLVEDLPEGKGWQFEPKWDGFRCLAYRAGDEVALRAKSGKPLSRYFPEVTAMLLKLKQQTFVLDGELIVRDGGVPSFDALQMRIHPAESRIQKLSTESPATLIVFDMLIDTRRRSLLETPLSARREDLEAFFAKISRDLRLKLSPATRSRAKAGQWLKRGGAVLDGVIAKQVDGLYLPGERAMLKVKQLRTADCVVGGFRYATGSKQVGSLLLGLYNDEGKLDHVGFTATISNAERAALTKRLEALEGEPGFTGDTPGGPSRWSTERSSQWVPLKPKLVVEVKYDQVTGGRFRHGTRLLRFRPDKAPRQCTFEQIERPASSRLLAKLVG
jgi:ATP-dependent DNA ligase